MSEQEDLTQELSDKGMRINQGRDPLAWVGICITVLINIASVAWIAGRFEERMKAAELTISKLEVKAEKDSAQDVQIAVISSKLDTISSGVVEIKAKLEARK